MTSERSEYPLEKCLEVLIDYRGKSPKKSATGIPVISAKVVKGGRILEPVEQTIDPTYYEEWMRRGLPEVGDVVMTTEAPLGEVARLNARTAQYALGQRIVTMRGRRGCLDNGYLKYLLLSHEMQDRLYRRATGTTVLGISQNALRQVELPLPDFDTQSAIAKILGDLDDKINLLREMNRTLEEIARAVFRAWFVDFEPVRAKAAGASSFRGMPEKLFATLPKSFDTYNDRSIPRGWRIERLGSIIEHPRRAVNPNEIDENTPYIGLEHMPRRSISLADWETAEKVSSNKHKFARFEFLFGKLRPNFHKVGVAFVDGICSTDVVVLRSTKPEFFGVALACISSDEFIAYNVAATYGTKMPRTSWDIIERFGLVLPEAASPIMGFFSDFIRAIVEKLEANVFEIRTLASIRDTLLPKLISGEIEAPSLEALGLKATDNAG